MFVKHLQEYLDKFTQGPNGTRGNAVSNARIYIAMPNGYLEEIKRIEVHESTVPGDTSVRVVLKPNKEELKASVQIAKERGLEIVCRALVNSNEFAFLP